MHAFFCLFSLLQFSRQRHIDPFPISEVMLLKKYFHLMMSESCNLPQEVADRSAGYQVSVKVRPRSGNTGGQASAAPPAAAAAANALWCWCAAAAACRYDLSDVSIG
jgi:hypothetical protein